MVAVEDGGVMAEPIDDLFVRLEDIDGKSNALLMVFPR